MFARPSDAEPAAQYSGQGTERAVRRCVAVYRCGVRSASGVQKLTHNLGSERSRAVAVMVDCKVASGIPQVGLLRGPAQADPSLMR